MTLTFELVRDIIKDNVSAKFQVCSSNGSTVRALTNRHTDTQTGPILYPRQLTREGNDILFPKHWKALAFVISVSLTGAKTLENMGLLSTWCAGVISAVNGHFGMERGPDLSMVCVC